MAIRDIVVVGASAGGVQPLREIVRALPEDYPGSLFVVLHTSPRESSSLADLLTRAGPLKAVEVLTRESVRAGRIYVARPNRHLVLEPDVARSLMGAKESLHRPSVDVLMRSAAVAYGERVVAVILSGMLDDGVAGAAMVRAAGGLVVAQDPGEAEHPSMPQTAIARGVVHHVLAAGAVAELLRRVAVEESHVETGAGNGSLMDSTEATMFPVSCPSCNGTLRYTRDGGVPRYRCRVGHAFSSDSLSAEHEENLERALWTALRVLEERVVLQKRLAGTARERRLDAMADVHEEKAQRAEREIRVLRRVVESDLSDRE